MRGRTATPFGKSELIEPLMSNEPKATPDQQPGHDGGIQPAAAGTDGPPQANGGEAGEAPPKHHDDIIAELRREVADLKDRVLRAHAEVENVRKRSDREKEETSKYAVTKFARDVLNVGDNFQRALSAVPAGAADSDPALKALVEGVVMTEREYLNVLERHGVKRIEAQDQPFNPHLHQAVMEMPRPDIPAGTIVQVFQAGFTIGDRTLRPAMVVVSSGGPKAQKPGEAAPQNNGSEPPPQADGSETPGSDTQQS